ncbi:methylated-DNA--[protein]-cysteine S-methyltransferase [Streptomyces sp. H10-C2]|uniref:methylated-DNA--[protein]-cysteine S-methyltransferase n=1 Tax=unclassified Streptomyces TaxID=2593676 RepID=UPI0024BABBBE|nr:MULTISPECIES: methylated-DNA--[protein]-cysteine S-methyltransferase [unclassified Streptomyces]MDJ0340731.1 methylated-DNA--[protein]-cysteine S-methyltransferase [Streptomyces sp. PH10-H1]MDJ0371997.1 methylated-DNA--[protein]-cysteine S-methyltransferase [Streptomyces sp. H10-C2]
MTSPVTTPVTLYTTFDSPLGELLLTSDGTALTSLSVPGQRGGATILPGWRHEPTAFTEAERQLKEYFAGDRREFDLPLAPTGTDFRRRVWNALDAVPYGATVTYRDLAAAAGSPGAVRAIGGAVGGNPLLVLRPCHRVIGADGSLTGYSGGLDRKRTLLALEGVL